MTAGHLQTDRFAAVGGQGVLRLCASAQLAANSAASARRRRRRPWRPEQQWRRRPEQLHEGAYSRWASNQTRWPLHSMCILPRVSRCEWLASWFWRRVVTNVSFRWPLIAGAFVMGMGAGVWFNSEASFRPNNVASTEMIDRKTPNSELCMANGYSSMVFDQRIFVSFNPCVPASLAPLHLHAHDRQILHTLYRGECATRTCSTYQHRLFIQPSS